PSTRSLSRLPLHVALPISRPSARVCRIGGDEFAVIFYEPTGPRQEGSRHPASVFAIAQRFQAQIQQHRFPKLSDCAPGTLTISGERKSTRLHSSHQVISSA